MLCCTTYNLSDIRGAISGAFDIVQSLPESLKVHFAEKIVTLGARLSVANAIDDAIHLLQIAVSCIDLLRGNADTEIHRYSLLTQYRQ